MDIKYIIAFNNDLGKWGVYELLPTSYMPILVEPFDRPEDALRYLQNEV